MMDGDYHNDSAYLAFYACFGITWGMLSIVPTVAFGLVIESVGGELPMPATVPWSVGMFFGFMVMWAGVGVCVMLWQESRK